MNYPGRRRFNWNLIAITAAAAVSPGSIHQLGGLGITRLSRREDHFSTGKSVAATSTSREATAAALGAMQNGGNAADAYMAAALTQTVVEPGLTSIGGAFGMTFFDAKKKQTSACVGKLGAAKDEPYDFDRKFSPNRTGRAMPVPGFIAGDHQAHKTYGTLPWEKLFEPAIGHAREGAVISPQINRDHVRGKGATAPGISTSYALYRDGKPSVIIGSPGFGFVHGPYPFGTGVVEWELDAPPAMNLPRFSLPNANGVAYFESHYDKSVFDMLKKRGIKHNVGRPSTSTGLVGALFAREDDSVQVVQDGRRDGWARTL